MISFLSLPFFFSSIDFKIYWKYGGRRIFDYWLLEKIGGGGGRRRKRSTVCLYCLCNWLLTESSFAMRKTWIWRLGLIDVYISKSVRMGPRISKGDFIVYINHWLLNRPTCFSKFRDYDTVPWKFVSDREYFLLPPPILHHYFYHYLIKIRINERKRTWKNLLDELFLRNVVPYNFLFHVEIATSIATSTFNFFTVAGTDGTKDQRTVDDARRMNFATHEFFHRCYKFAPFVSKPFISVAICIAFPTSVYKLFFFFFTIFFIYKQQSLTKPITIKLQDNNISRRL